MFAGLDVWFAAPIGALLIFLLRIVDVSMAMIRMILAVRGKRGLAAIIGFFEVLIWIVAVGQALQHVHSLLHLVGYAGGFAMGNYVGVWLEGRFAIGVNVVQAVCRVNPDADGKGGGKAAAAALRGAGFAVTEIQGRGRESDVEILNVVVPRKSVPRVLSLIGDSDPDAFVSVEEVRTTRGGYVRPGGRKMPFMTRA
jgi:uncharacterized protein YebE (UPF0316 family)